MVEWGNPHFPLRGLLGRGVLCKFAPVPLDPGVFVDGRVWANSLPAASARHLGVRVSAGLCIHGCPVPRARAGARYIRSRRDLNV